MEKKEYLKGVEAASINEQRVDEIEKLYNAVLPEILSKIISIAKETVFLMMVPEFFRMKR